MALAEGTSFESAGITIHYTDMGGLFHGTLKQLKLSDRFAEAGISAVLGMGSAPGAPGEADLAGAVRFSPRA